MTVPMLPAPTPSGQVYAFHDLNLDLDAWWVKRHEMMFYENLYPEGQQRVVIRSFAQNRKGKRTPVTVTLMLLDLDDLKAGDMLVSSYDVLDVIQCN